MKRNVWGGSMFAGVFIKLGFISLFSPTLLLDMCVLWHFRESPLMSLDPSSSFSTTLRTLPSPCRCIILPLAPLAKVRVLATGTDGCICGPLMPSAYKVTESLLMLLLTDEFARAVYVATGQQLTHHLVHTIFKIFDVDHDDQLSYKEFIGIMKDRLHRGARVRQRNSWKKKSMSIKDSFFR